MLKIARNFELPDDSATETFAILGRRGSGKTNTAKVIIERMLDAGDQVIILDPKGEHWGLRLKPDGKSRAYDLPVFGGLRGDVPLEHTAGNLIADTLIDRNLSGVVDVSLLPHGKRQHFAAEFARRLMDRRRRNPSPTCLVLEEAKFFAPQTKTGNDAVMAAAYQDFPLVGRSFGFGLLIITQRPALVDKSLLSQAECMIAMQVVGPHDRKAIREWVKEQGDETAMDVGELPGLEVGEGFIWSPGWLRTCKRLHFLKQRTFDAGATPKRGEKRVDPRPLDEAALEGLRGAMAESVERVEANDPKKLRAELSKAREQIRRLEAEGAKADPEALERARQEGVAEERARFAQVVKKLENARKTQAEALQMSVDGIGLVVSELAEPLGIDVPAPAAPAPRAVRTVSEPRPSRPARPNEVTGDSAVSEPMQRVLNAMAWLDSIGMAAPYSRVQVAFVAGYRPTSGGLQNLLGKLRSAGLVVYPASGEVELTEAGAAVAVAPSTLPSREELHRRVRDRISAPMWNCLEPLIGAYPNAMSRTEIAEIAGYSPTSGGLQNLLGKLRTLKLVDYPSPGEVVAREVLFP